MATQVFADEELERLRGFPEIGRDELFRFFTLMPADVAFVDPGQGAADRLGLAVTLCTLPWLGFVPDDVAAAPPVAVARLVRWSSRSWMSSCWRGRWVETEAPVQPTGLWRPAVVRTGHTVLIQGSQYPTEWQRSGRAAVKHVARAGLLTGGVVPVDLIGPGNVEALGSVYR